MIRLICITTTKEKNVSTHINQVIENMKLQTNFVFELYIKTDNYKKWVFIILILKLESWSFFLKAIIVYLIILKVNPILP